MSMLYKGDYYTAKRPNYIKKNVFFNRFCYDFLSMFGDNLKILDHDDLDFIIRKLYQDMTHSFKGKVKLLKLRCIDTSFSTAKIFTKDLDD